MGEDIYDHSIILSLTDSTTPFRPPNFDLGVPTWVTTHVFGPVAIDSLLVLSLFSWPVSKRVCLDGVRRFSPNDAGVLHSTGGPDPLRAAWNLPGCEAGKLGEMV